MGAHVDWPSMRGDESSTTTIPPWRHQSLWRIIGTRTVEGLSEQPRCEVKQLHDALLKKHAIECTMLMKEFEDMKAAGNGKNEEFEAKGKEWKQTIEEIFSLMKELTERTCGQKAKENFEEGQKEVVQSQESGTKIDGYREEQSISVSQTRGVKRKVEELQEIEEQSFSDSQRNKKEEGEGKIKKKKARRNGRQRLIEKVDDRKKRTRKCARKRRRNKGRCELSKEEEEQEVKTRRKLKS